MNRKIEECIVPKFEQGGVFTSKGYPISITRKKKLIEKLKDKFINWIFKDLIYDAEIKTTREKLSNIRKELQELDRFKRETLKDIEKLYKIFYEEEKRQDMFNESVYRFLPKVYEVYHKNLELNNFREKYVFNSDAKELRKFTEEKIEKEIKEILERVDTK